MVSTRSSILFLTSAFALQGHAGATSCDADNYSKVSTAVQTLRTNCTGWAAYLSNGGVWTCDSTCHDAVGNLVNTVPDCMFGGPHGQNYKEVVEDMVETCGDQLAPKSDLPTSPSATTAAPSTTTMSPVATTNAPTTSNNTSSTEAASATSPPTSATASSSAKAGDTPASEVSTTSGANMQAISSIAAVIMLVSSMVLH